MSQRSDEQGRVSPHGRVVAVVDDDEAVCDSTRLLLEIQNFEVRTYLSGLDFLKDDTGIGCVILDYHMPDLNGLELALALRARGSQVPIIMITAATDPTLERRAAQLGVKRILHKPLSSQLLFSALREELG
jgi:two-component system, LuxR family, response regulator FixJ